MPAIGLPVVGLLLAPAMAVCTEPVAVILSARGAVSAGPALLEAPSVAPHRPLLRSELFPGKAAADGGPELGGTASPGAAGLPDWGRQPILVHRGSVGSARSARPAPAPQGAGAKAHGGSGLPVLGQPESRDLIMGEVLADREQVDISALINSTARLSRDLQALGRTQEQKVRDYKSFEAVAGAKSVQAVAGAVQAVAGAKGVQAVAGAKGVQAAAGAKGVQAVAGAKSKRTSRAARAWARRGKSKRTSLAARARGPKRKSKRSKSKESKSERTSGADRRRAPTSGPKTATLDAAERVDQDVQQEQAKVLQVFHDVGIVDDLAKGYRKDALKALEAATKVGRELTA